MSIGLLSLLFVLVFVIILIAGLPLAFATGAVAVIFTYLLFGEPGLTLVISRIFTLMGNYVLVSVPLFIFMACILERAGVAEDIFKAVYVWAGRLRGGLAAAVIVSCALMAAMVGVIGAEIVTMGVVALPAMLSRGYKKENGARLHLRGRRPRHADSAQRCLHHVRPDRRRLDRPALHRGHHPGPDARRLYIAYILIRCYFAELAPPRRRRRAAQ